MRGVYRSIREPALVVIDKQNGGCKSDALNAGINVASGELVLTIDADTVLVPDALSRAVLPFLEDPTTVAVGGNVAIANGCRIEHGRITDVALPRSWLARFQIIEYMRSFLLFRVAWVSTNAVTLISGALGLFRRDAVIAVGGYDRTAIGEDMDLTLRLQRFYREQGSRSESPSIPFRCARRKRPRIGHRCQSQRCRWRRGLLQSLWRHRSMIGNPRFGVVGLCALPHLTVFEGFRAAARGERLHHRDGGGVARHSRLATLRCAHRRGGAVRHRGTLMALLLSDLSMPRYVGGRDLSCWLPLPCSKTAAIASSMPGGGVWGRCRPWRGVHGWGTIRRRAFEGKATPV